MKSRNLATTDGGHGIELTIDKKDYIPYIPGILWAVDKELRYLDIDGQKLKEWNLSRQDIIGKNVQEFHDEQENGTNTTQHRLAFAHGTSHYRVEFGGNEYECKLHYLEEREIIVGIATDISKETALEQQVSDQAASLLEMSTPVVPLLDNAVIIPVTGQLTLTKARHIQQHVILQVHGMSGVDTVIMDFSGVTDVVACSEDVLEKVYRSFKMLGIATILTGVTPDLSQKLVLSGTILRVDRIYSTLKMAVSELITARG